jgi:hypothetical protein
MYARERQEEEKDNKTPQHQAGEVFVKRRK